VGSLDFIFQGDQLYPEYLTDYKVLVCPSDADGSKALTGGRWNLGGDPKNGINPCRFDGLSYVYLSWALQDMYKGTQDVNSPNIPTDIMASVSAGYLNLSLATKLLQLSNQVSAGAVNLLDEDVVLPAPDGRTAYRLREGIERFLITDINNAGAGNQAQSEIYVFWDTTSIKADNFNHVPGGSNVLYMDGHCEFVKFPGPANSPVSRAFASLVGGALQQ